MLLIYKAVGIAHNSQGRVDRARSRGAYWLDFILQAGDGFKAGESHDCVFGDHSGRKDWREWACKVGRLSRGKTEVSRPEGSHRGDGGPS